MGKHSTIKDDTLHASLWLVFRRDGSVRLTRSPPDVSRDERALALTAQLPLSLFRVPTLSATLTVDAPDFPPKQIDLIVAGEALKSALGVDIDLMVRESE